MLRPPVTFGAHLRPMRDLESWNEIEDATEQALYHTFLILATSSFYSQALACKRQNFWLPALARVGQKSFEMKCDIPGTTGSNEADRGFRIYSQTSPLHREAVLRERQD